MQKRNYESELNKLKLYTTSNEIYIPTWVWEELLEEAERLDSDLITVFWLAWETAKDRMKNGEFTEVPDVWER